MKQNVEIYGGAAPAKRSWLQAALRGFSKKCPQCGHGRLFRGYTTTTHECDHCGLTFSGHRADDAPPYLTIMIVGHVVIPVALIVKQIFDPPMALQFAIWTPVILLSTLWLLPAAKGALIGVQWANYMHGFSISPAANSENGATLDA